MIKTLFRLLGFVAVFSAAAAADATIIFDGSPGSGPPPATLGPYSMTPFPPDPSPIFTTITSLRSPIGGELGFSPAVDHRVIGAGWAPWGHGYAGDVYYSLGETSVTMTMPQATGAFYFYAEPNFGYQAFEAIADDGTSSGPIRMHWVSDAHYFGFYATDGSVIRTITVTTTADFAVGEFAIAAVPESASAALLAIGAVMAARRSPRRRR